MGEQGDGGPRRVVTGVALDDDVEEEEVGLRDREEEVAGASDGLEVAELVGELGDGGDVVAVAADDDLGVGLGEVGERRGSIEERQEEVAIALERGGGGGRQGRDRGSEVHLLTGGMATELTLGSFVSVWNCCRCFKKWYH